MRSDRPSSSRRRPRAGLSTAIILLLVAGTAAAPVPAWGADAGPSPQAVAPPAGAAVLVSLDPTERPVGREDLLEISVFEVPELSRTVRVSEKGTVSLPLIGVVEASGLTPRQLEMRLRDRLSGRYVRDPQVSVFVREHGSKRVSVLGAVGKPGVYEMLGPRTLLQVLAQAGGLTENAGAEIFVMRGGGGELEEPIMIRVADLMASAESSADVPVQPGDIISVPPDRVLYIYVDGAVRTPGRIEQPASRALTLLQAIAKAGGATERANLKKVQILRKRDAGTQSHLEVSVHRIRKGDEPDPLLQDGDVVVVNETFF